MTAKLVECGSTGQFIILLQIFPGCYILWCKEMFFS